MLGDAVLDGDSSRARRDHVYPVSKDLGKVSNDGEDLLELDSE